MSHIDRMKAEHKELETKTRALNTFIHSNEIFKALDDLERARMIKQVGFMESYLDVLSQRIWVALES